MRLIERLLCVACFGLLSGEAAASHVDPYAVMQQAFEAYQKNENYSDVRAVLSQALREAAHDGVLDPSYAILYTMYADTARFEGNPSFALQLTEQGLDLVVRGEDPSESVKNALLVSRGYALADLGRYEEAVEAARITVLWMGETTGKEHGERLEADAKGWAEQAAAADKDYRLPSVAELAIELTKKAQQAVNDGDTGAALMLASRAIVPPNTGLSDAATRYVNALSHTISGIAYAREGQHARALTSFRRGIDLVVTGPWDGRSKPKLDASLLAQAGDGTMIWDLFANMALSASFVGEKELVVAALDVAAEYAATPEARRSLMLQQASAAFRSADFERAEETFRRGAAAARADGKEADALLAEFYVTIARLSQVDQKPQAPELAELARAAERAADAFGEDLWMADYILATAVRMSYSFRFDYDRARRDAELGQHPERRYPVGNAEFPGEAGAVIVLHEAGIDQHVAVAALRQDERERQVHHAVIVHAADEVDPGLVLGAGELHHIDVPVRGLWPCDPPSAFRERAAKACQPDRDDENGALKDELREGRGAEDVEAVEAEHDDQRADERAEHVELAVAQRGRPEEHRGKRGEQIGIGGIGGAAAESRGEQRAGERRAHARQRRSRGS